MVPTERHAIARPDVTIIIVSYRTREMTLACLRSLEAATTRMRYRVILVDNASGDGTAEAVRREHPDVSVMALSANEGFGAAVNRAAHDASGDFLLLLNPDTVVHPGAIEALITFARRHPQHGLYGGQTFDAQGRVDPRSVWGSPTRWSVLCWGLGLSSLFPRSFMDSESLGRWQRDSVREVDVIVGALLLIPTALWRELGGFDERFFMYSEDVDLSMRARQRGWRPIMTPAAQITHYIGASTPVRGDKLVMVMSGRVTLVKKHWSRAWAWYGVVLLQLGVALRASGQMIASRIRGQSAPDQPWVTVWRKRPQWARGWTQA